MQGDSAKISGGRLMQLATLAAVVSAAVLVVFKALVYFDTKSVALLSSLADSALDLLASGVTFMAVRVALTPADKEHRFGHGKAEPLSGLGQAAFVAGSAVLVMVEAISRFHSPAPLDNATAGIVVMVAATLVTFALVTLQRMVIKRTGSVAISADSLHYTGDLLMNISVIVALVLSSQFGLTWADPLFAIGISLFMLINAVHIAKSAVGGLMDHELPEDDRKRIIAIAVKHPKVKHVHELRTRTSGLQKFIQMHVVLDRTLSLLEAHRITDDVEKAVESEFPGADIIIHQDPEGIVEFHQPVGCAVVREISSGVTAFGRLVMSTVKNILAVISDAKNGRAPLRAALNVARYLNSHVDVAHVKPDPTAALPLVGEAMSGAMVDEMMQFAERDGVARATAVRAMFDELVGSGGLAASWLEASGVEEQVVAVRACRADLIVLGRPIPDNETAALLTLNAALMQSGRPVLVAPPGDNADAGFKHIALFWNGSAEATRAVTAALPFLTAAEQVSVLRAEEEEWFAPTEDLEAFLAHHQIKAVVSRVLPREGRTGMALLKATTDAGADMMVMGAYTRSKLRQLILGSVTGYVMQHATLPVLLCH